MFGNYEISYSSPNGCVLDTTLVLLEDSDCASTSVDLILEMQALELYPNPVQSNFISEGTAREIPGGDLQYAWSKMLLIFLHRKPSQK